MQERDAHSLAAHAQRISFWKQVDPSGVAAFWLLALQQTWADCNQMTHSIAFDLGGFNYQAGVNITPLIETLLNLPRSEHDLFGHAIARCIEAGGVSDEILWRYIAGDIKKDDLLGYQLGDKLRCNPSEFRDGNFLQERMLTSEQLLNLSIGAVETWSGIKSKQDAKERG